MEIIYATRAYLRGPWLIDSKALEEFDELLDRESAKLRMVREAEFENAVTSKVEERLKTSSHYRTPPTPEDIAEVKADVAETLLIRGKFQPEQRSINIYFKSEKRIRVERFGDAFRMPEIADELPTGFAVAYECGTVSLSVSVRRNTAGLIPKLEIEVSPPASQNAKELYAVVRAWASSTQPSLPQKTWSTIAPLHWIGWLCLMVLFVSTVGDLSASYREQGRAMLQKGLKPEDELKAIETILAIESQFVPPGQSPSIPRPLKLFAFGSFLACCVLSIWPTVSIGIAKGRERVRFWRAYSTFVFATVPLTLMSWFLWPFLVGIVKRWLS